MNYLRSVRPSAETYLPARGRTSAAAQTAMTMKLNWGEINYHSNELELQRNARPRNLLAPPAYPLSQMKISSTWKGQIKKGFAQSVGLTARADDNSDAFSPGRRHSTLMISFRPIFTCGRKLWSID